MSGRPPAIDRAYLAKVRPEYGSGVDPADAVSHNLLIEPVYAMCLAPKPWVERTSSDVN